MAQWAKVFFEMLQITFDVLWLYKVGAQWQG